MISDSFLAGIADCLYPKIGKANKVTNNRPPFWMNSRERREWLQGYNYMKSLFI